MVRVSETCTEDEPHFEIYGGGFLSEGLNQG